MKLTVMAVGLAIGSVWAFGQAAPDEQELKKSQAHFRAVMEQFRKSPEYWEQKATFDRLVAEAHQSGGAERFRRAVEEAALQLEPQRQRYDMEWLIRTAAAGFEKRRHEDHLRRSGMR